MLKLKSENIEIGTNTILKTELVSRGNYMVTQNKHSKRWIVKIRVNLSRVNFVER